MPARRLGQVAVAVFAMVLVAAAVVFGVWATSTGSPVVFGRLTGLAGVFSLVLAVAVAAVSMLAWARRFAGRQLPAPSPAVVLVADLAAVCAFLAPEPVPTAWFPRAAAGLPPPLAGVAADPVAWREVLARLRDHALARIDHDELQMHRLTQAILRGYLPPELAAATSEQTEVVLAANHPGETTTPVTWSAWAQLLPHLLAADLAAADIEGLRGLALDASWYLVRRGDARTGRDLAGRLHRKWCEQLGTENRHTLEAAAVLAYSLREMGCYREAWELDEDTLAVRRRVLGEDHPDTLRSAGDLACDLYMLGKWETARRLEEDTLARQGRVLGEDHPDTLRSADNLACVLYRLGERRAARRLEEDTLARRRRVLGEDHPDTLRSADNLAFGLSATAKAIAIWTWTLRIFSLGRALRKAPPDEITDPGHSSRR